MYGKRGEGYVIIQFTLLFIIAFAPAWGPLNALPLLRPIGIMLMGLSILLALWSASVLGRNLTPLPRPRLNNELVRTGPYRFVRHPMYTAVLLGAFGFSLFRPSLIGMLVTVLLLGLFDKKSKREEVWLSELHSDYTDYQKQVKKLIPWVY